MKNDWPALPYTEWIPTYETLHRWLQIIGKFKVRNTPWLNHSWNSTFSVTARGLSTNAIALDERILTIDFDFLSHKLIIQDSSGRFFEMLLKNESVSSFHARFLSALKSFEVDANFSGIPDECADVIPFADDEIHCTYNPDQAENFFQVLVRVANVFQEFRADFVGKSSPVHFFWGSFDLAISRFSGKEAPEHPGGVPHLSNVIVREAYSHEVMSCGFWPGNDTYPQAAFYAYAYPEPKDFSLIPVPNEAFYHTGLHEFILDYEVVRASEDPAGLIRDFIEATYLGAADSGGWNRQALEHSRPLEILRDQLS
jgi:hypothetical protein